MKAVFSSRRYSLDRGFLFCWWGKSRVSSESWVGQLLSCSIYSLNNSALHLNEQCSMVISREKDYC